MKVFSFQVFTDSTIKMIIDPCHAEYICATTCDFQQCGILISVDSDEPVEPLFMLRNRKLCSVSGLGVIKYSSDKQML